MTQIVNLPAFVRGNDISYRIVIKEEGVAVNVQGDLFFMTLKSQATDPDIIAAMQIVKEIEIDDADALIGVVILPFTSDSTNIKARAYDYDIKWKRLASGMSELITVIKGKVEVLQNITVSTDI